MAASFYVKDVNGNLVPAQFLTNSSGKSVQDPNASNAEHTMIYNSAGTLQKNANPNGYIISPYGYSLNEPAMYGQTASKMTLSNALGYMESGFIRGGSQDVQRNYSSISGATVTNGPAVLAFQDAASYALGVATAYSGIPLVAAEVGGGFINLIGGGKDKGGLNTLFNNPLNIQSMKSGYASVPAQGLTLPGGFNGTYNDPVSGGTFGFNTDANGNYDVTYAAPSGNSYSDTLNGTAVFSSSGSLSTANVAYSDPNQGLNYSIAFQQVGGVGQLTENGNGGVVNVDPTIDTNVIVNGTGVTGYIPEGNKVNVQGNNSDYDMQADASAQFTGGGNQVIGSLDSVLFGKGSTGTVSGSQDAVTLTSNSKDSVDLDGTGFQVYTDTGTDAVALIGTGTTAEVRGAGFEGIYGAHDSLDATGEAYISVGNDLKGIKVYASYASIVEGKGDDVAVYGYGDHISAAGGDYNSGSYSSGGGYDGGGGGGGGYSGGGGDSGGGSSDDFVRNAKALKSPTTAAAHSSPLTQVETAAQATAGSTGSPNTSSSTASGHTSPMTQAELALARAQGAMNAEAKLGVVTKPVFEGGKWKAAVPAGASATATTAKPTITWSFADSPGTATDPFSGYLSAHYKATVEKAVQAWAVASGLTFKEVADSPSSDIRIGWGALDTSQSGLIGTTSYHETKGAMQAGTIIRLEDPSATPLVRGATGQLTYKGTGATLYQVALHEIGHALGLADDSDPSSVMYASSSNKNRKLDATDVKGIQSLYGSLGTAPTTAAASPISAAHASGVNQLIQAMATFAPKQATAPLSTVVAAAALAPTLATPARH